MSANEAAQHMGIGTKESSEGTSGVVRRDQLASLASNKRLMDALSEEQKNRYKHIKAAKLNQQPQTQENTNKQPTVIRRKKPTGE